MAAVAIMPELPAIASEKKQPVRFAHLTDIHVRPGDIPETGMARALQHVRNSRVRVDFIVNGGDAIMDALEANRAQTQSQWEVFHRILRTENNLPVYHCIGNHDIWGWFLKDGSARNDSQYGKRWTLDELGLTRPYYSFSRGAWQVIVLDSTQLNPGGGYIARLDEEQLEWLKGELQSTSGKFVCILSHIPILSISSGLFFDRTESNGDLKIQRNLMHSDFLVLKKLFRSHPQVRACISGHTHLQDAIDYLGVKYYCNGAVSGNWWKGSFQEFGPAYALIELHDDGRVERRMVAY